MLVSVQRMSPVSLPAAPQKTVDRNGWSVVLEYEAEGKGPHLIDLSHRPKWDVQNADLDHMTPWGCRVPEKPGGCIYDNGILINRMNRTQASVWHLWGSVNTSPQGSECSEITDAVMCLAIVGKNLFSMTEKLSSLDLYDSGLTPPCLIQGPFAHVPCQMVIMKRKKDEDEGALVLTCSRGYANDMVHAILEAGKEFGIRPAGENALAPWVQPS